MQQLGDGVWDVESDSSAKSYTVNLASSEGYATCTCTWWSVQRNKSIGRGLTPQPCKHIKRVQAHPDAKKSFTEKKAEVVKEKAGKTASSLRDLLADLDEPKVKPIAEGGNFVKMLESQANEPVASDATPETIVPEPVAEPEPVTDEGVNGVDEVTVTLTAAEVEVILLGLTDLTGCHAEGARAKLQGTSRPREDAPVHSDHTCPRCGGGIPNDAQRGEYPGALSRTDNTTEVCSQCGTDEAMQQFLDGKLSPQSDWPLTRTYDFPPAKVK